MKKSLTHLHTEPLKPSILVSGSLVYDTIFDLRGKMQEQIVIENGKLGKQNLMFTGKEKKVYFGGTAGNIAYGLSKLGLSPYVFSVVGRDFDFYEEHLKNIGVDLKLKRDPVGFTSTFYAMTDDNREQIGIYQGGCADKHLNSLLLKNCLSEQEIKNIKIAIFSPGTAKSITKQMVEFRKINKTATVIFDPGQMVAIDFTPELLKIAFRNCDIGIFNDIECNTLHNKHGFDLKKIFSLGVKYVVETKGEIGSSVYELENGEIKEVFVKSKKVKAVDPTGAGDAFRAGFIDSMLKGKSLKDSLISGNAMGAKCVKSFGGQTY